MVVAQYNRIARSTLYTVEEVFLATNPANATIIAMVLPFLCIIIIKFAYITVVLSHIDSTAYANLRHQLFSITEQTNYFFNILATYCMTISRSRGIVVAVAAGEHLVAARRHNFAPPPIMLAPVLHLAHVAALDLTFAALVDFHDVDVAGEVRSPHPRRRRRRRRGRRGAGGRDANSEGEQGPPGKM